MRNFLIAFLICGSLYGQGQLRELGRLRQEQIPTGAQDAIEVLNPIMYLDGGSIDATATTEGDPISTWDDKTANNLDVTQTGTARPVLHIATGGGRQARFDGTDDWLDETTNNSLLNLLPGTDEFTIVVREGDTKPTTGYYVSKATTSAGNRQYGIFTTAVDRIQTYVGGVQENEPIANTATTNRLFIVTVSTTLVNLWVDGVIEILDGSIGTNTDAGQSLNVGSRTDGSFLYDGDMDLLAIIPGVITQTEREAIETEFQIN